MNSIRPKNGSSVARALYIVDSDLSVREGLTRLATSAGFDAKLTINRSDFGIAMYVPNVSDEIAIEITTETRVPNPDGEKPAADKK